MSTTTTTLDETHQFKVDFKGTHEELIRELLIKSALMDALVILNAFKTSDPIPNEEATGMLRLDPTSHKYTSKVSIGLEFTIARLPTVIKMGVLFESMIPNVDFMIIPSSTGDANSRRLILTVLA
jgi:hypothetical protein